jgi:hypothetical protein
MALDTASADTIIKGDRGSRLGSHKVVMVVSTSSVTRRCGLSPLGRVGNIVSLSLKKCGTLRPYRVLRISLYRGSTVLGACNAPMDPLSSHQSQGQACMRGPKQGG